VISVYASDITQALLSSSQRIRTLLATSWGFGLSVSNFTSSLTGRPAYRLWADCVPITSCIEIACTYAVLTTHATPCDSSHDLRNLDIIQVKSLACSCRHPGIHKRHLRCPGVSDTAVREPGGSTDTVSRTAHFSQHAAAVPHRALGETSLSPCLSADCELCAICAAIPEKVASCAGT
jgi:hypothetical protein